MRTPASAKPVALYLTGRQTAHCILVVAQPFMRMELTVADTIIQRLPGSTSSATETRPSFTAMDSVVLDSVTKGFRHRPALFNWLSRERSGETRLSSTFPCGCKEATFLCCR